MWLLLALACAPWSDGDFDGDGVRAPMDCDDGDASIRPDGPDPVGDGTDTNCDGMDGVDSDGDGFASLKSGGDDCDDTEPGAHPGGEEVCNFIDDDCDGRVDIDAVDGTRLYLDLDGDGFGGGPGAVSCEQPDDSWLTEGGDCAEDDPDVYPTAPEPCGLDLNCDGAVGSCDSTVGLLAGGVVLEGPALRSAAGWSVDAVGDVDGDGWPDIVVGAPEEGQAWVVGGPFASSGSIAGRAVVGLTGSDGAGSSVAGVGDVDGDGYADVLIGADLDTVGGIEAGAAWLIHGGVAGPGTGSFSQEALMLIGEDVGDHAGAAVAGPGDANADGVPDLLIGAPDYGLDNTGAVYLVAGQLAANENLGAADLKLVASEVGMRAGASVAGGDMDGDGVADLVIGGPGALEGRAWAIAGEAGVAQQTVSLDLAGGRLRGVADGDELGWSVAIGDADGDGHQDLWVSSPGSDEARGAAWLVLGDSPPGPALTSVDIAAAASVHGLAVGERLGESVTFVPDIDGDGADELAIAGVGAATATDSDGAVWVFIGPKAGPLDVDSADAWLTGTQSSDALGAGLGSGDLNLDGVGDLLIGAPGAGAPGQGTGQLRLLYGG